MPPEARRRPPFMALAVMPAVYAWGASVVILIVGGLLFLNDSGPAPSQKFVDLVIMLFAAAAIYGSFTALIVFGSCVLVVAPLLRFLPRSSPLWHPVPAAVAGAVAGFVAIYLWTSLLFTRVILPSADDRTTSVFAGAAVVAGATFAVLFARVVRKQ